MLQRLGRGGGVRRRLLGEEGAAVPGSGCRAREPRRLLGVPSRGKTAALGRFTGVVAFVSIWWMIVGFRQLNLGTNAGVHTQRDGPDLSL